MSGKVQLRQQILDQAKAAPCVDCRRTLPPCCMDFDHTRGTKFAHVSSMLTYNIERFNEEIQKCEVVCACCHRIRTEVHRKPSKFRRLVQFHADVDDLKNAPCLDCGQHFPPVAMDFDHVRGEKRFFVSRMWRYSWENVLAEVAKCDLVCANCHRMRTQTRKKVALC